MIKSNFLAIILLICVQASAMQGNFAWLCSVPKNNGNPNDKVYVNDGRGGRKEEIYDRYFCSLQETATEDDTQKLLTVAQPLFVQLCVQASKNKNLDSKPFSELLTRIKSRTIDADAQMVALTKKDGNHRLLSYIPEGQIHQLVNGKKVRLIFLLKKEPVVSSSSSPSSQSTQNDDFSKNEADFLFPSNTNGSSQEGKNFRLTGEKELRSNYDFVNQDPSHHAKIAAEYNELLQRAQH